MTIETIYNAVAVLINNLIRREHTAQGHYLTGELENSLDYKTKRLGNVATLEGYAIWYAKTLNEGLQPSQISMKMLPGLVSYFVLRGLNPVEAKRAAGATINKWKQEGMSTQASRRFSQTGGRQHFIEAAFTHPEIDDTMSTLLDFAVEEKMNKVKSETI